MDFFILHEASCVVAKMVPMREFNIRPTISRNQTISYDVMFQSRQVSYKHVKSKDNFIGCHVKFSASKL